MNKCHEESTERAKQNQPQHIYAFHKNVLQSMDGQRSPLKHAPHTERSDRHFRSNPPMCSQKVCPNPPPGNEIRKSIREEQEQKKQML
ncbi:hypothetical protein EUGRSUZ_C03229 [Eucalyptus grandis]|uniref:Uncharacterized protein n=2 Tax=Eucalyptus grandis TaxID=71139 RepID=A0ACC3LJM9_EUCGR|nr:hypothetical protein EUGRSUZ_C03229 [Eucalyptus grandis]